MKFMDEDKDYNDWINMYLFDELTAEERRAFEDLRLRDKAFDKEVKIYEKLYLGIEQHAESQLRKRLDRYHDEYLQENKKKPGGIQRTMIFISSIAAALIIGFFLFIVIPYEPVIELGEKFESEKPAPRDSVPESREPVEDKGGLADDKLPEDDRNEPDVERERPGRLPDHIPNLALGGMSTLPASNLAYIRYPAERHYTFDGDTLTLFGDPLIPALQLRVLQTDAGQFVLRIADRYFPLGANGIRSTLTASPEPYGEGDATGSDVVIRFAEIGQSAVPYGGLEVGLAKDNSPTPSYFFEADKLILLTNWDLDGIKVYKVDFEGEEHYILVYRDGLFELDRDQAERTVLQPVSPLQNRLTRLFHKRDPLSSEVYSTRP